MVPQAFLKTLANHLGVSENEYEVLSRAIAGESLSAIAKELGIRQDALQKRLGEVYRKFKISGGGPGKLAKLQQILITEYQKQAAKLPSPATESPSATPPKLQLIDSSESFYGRHEELKILKQWILSEHPSVILLWGMGGMGKTALVKYLIRQIKSEFQLIRWLNCRDFSSLEQLFKNLIQSVSLNSATTFDQQTLQLWDFLHSSPSLLVFDELETLISECHSDQKLWQNLIQQFTQKDNPSCLLLISREKLTDFPDIGHELYLQGLAKTDSRKFFRSESETPPSELELIDELSEIYAGNPLALQLVSQTIQESFQGNYWQFVKQNTLDLSKLCRAQLQGLSELEMQIVVNLAIQGQPISFSALQLSLPETSEDLGRVIEKLKMRSLISLVSEIPQIQLKLAPEFRQKLIQRFIAKHFNKIGYQSYLKGELASAKAQLEQAIRFQPDFAQAHYNLGSTYEQLQDLSRARQHYQIAAKFENQGSYAAVCNLARFDILEGKFQEAANKILPVLTQINNPNTLASSYKNLGWAYSCLGDYQAAENYLRQALVVNPEFAIAQGLLAQTLEAQNQAQTAQEHWQNCLKFSEIHPISLGVYWQPPELKMLRVQAYQRLNSAISL